MAHYRQFSKCEEVDPVIVCRLCEDSWDKPVELKPCGHIFCKVCLTDYKSRCLSILSSAGSCANSDADNNEMKGVLCPTCRCAVLGVDSPNRLLVNMVLAVSVQCSRCGWQGSREQSERHVCGSVRVGKNGPVRMGGNSSELLRNFEVVESPPASRMEHDQATLALQPSVGENWEDYGLTQEEYDQIMGVFVHFDAEGKGFLTRAQLREFAFFLNYTSREEDINLMLSQMGCDEAGGLMVADLCRWLGSHHPNTEALYGFSRYQYTEMVLQYRGHMNSKGLLSWAAFWELCIRNSCTKKYHEVQELFKSRCNSDDGNVNLQQFLLLCQRLWGFGWDDGETASNIQQNQKQRQPHLLQQPPLPSQGQPQQGHKNSNGYGGVAMHGHPFGFKTWFQRRRKKWCSIM